MYVIVHFGFPGNTASDFLFILCLLYAGESQSISEAKKTTGCKHNSAQLDKWKSLP